jgi:hypothetical protein
VAWAGRQRWRMGRSAFWRLGLTPERRRVPARPWALRARRAARVAVAGGLGDLGDLGTWARGSRVWRWHGGGAKGARAARCRVACVSGRVGREFVARVLPRKGSNGGLGVGESCEKGAVGGV